MKFCPVQCLSGDIDEHGRQAEMRYDMAACAEMSEQYEALPRMLDQAIAAENAAEREAILTDLDNSMAWYKMSVGTGGLLAQCFECMRVCPIAIGAPKADPIRRAFPARGEAAEEESRETTDSTPEGAAGDTPKRTPGAVAEPAAGRAPDSS